MLAGFNKGFLILKLPMPLAHLLIIGSICVGLRGAIVQKARHSGLTEFPLGSWVLTLLLLRGSDMCGVLA